MHFGVINTVNAVTFFLPSIIAQLGYTSTEAQIRTIPVYVVTAVAALGTAYLADKLRHRYAFAIGWCCVGVVGYISLLLRDHVSVMSFIWHVSSSRCVGTRFCPLSLRG